MALDDRWRQVHSGFCRALLDDFRATIRYVAFIPDNHRTYSIEYLRLLLDTCSEIESLAKSLCEEHSRSQLRPNSNINDWRRIIVKHVPAFPSHDVRFQFQFSLQPWADWGKTRASNPAWWSAYNSVKHERSRHFHQANQLNVISALCGMSVFARYLFSWNFFGTLDESWLRVS